MILFLALPGKTQGRYISKTWYHKLKRMWPYFDSHAGNHNFGASWSNSSPMSTSTWCCQTGPCHLILKIIWTISNLNWFGMAISNRQFTTSYLPGVFNSFIVPSKVLALPLDFAGGCPRVLKICMQLQLPREDDCILCQNVVNTTAHYDKFRCA